MLLAWQFQESAFPLFDSTMLTCRHVKLSNRERECLAWSAEGLTAKEIARKLHRSVATVTLHLNTAVQKAGRQQPRAGGGPRPALPSARQLRTSIFASVQPRLPAFTLKAGPLSRVKMIHVYHPRRLRPVSALSNLVSRLRRYR
ncbi:helix-turn-helix transcriptional regulator [Klebsiella michiganensis]|nr:helix-turn-helix transcriptional regulator [Klebsiella michiganensis]